MNYVKFKIYALGCKVNQYDGNDLAAKLTAAGFVSVKNGADLAIINTCAVTKTALAKDRQMVARARKENTGAKIIIAGCAPKVYKEEMAGLGADLVVADREMEEIVSIISNFQFPISNEFPNLNFQTKSKIPARIASDSVAGGQNLKSKIGCASIAGENRNDISRSRYFIKVQDGCRQFCTYCIIPYVRGDLRSRQAEEVIAEVKQALARGYREIVLCGIHLGLYGVDHVAHNMEHVTTGSCHPELDSGSRGIEVKRGRTDNSWIPGQARDDKMGERLGEDRINLVTLLKQLIKIDGLGKIRLSSIEPNEVTDELIDLIKTSGKICRHLHIPLQSGNDKILKLMNRPYTTKRFSSKIKKIRQAVPGIALTTDVIVGFPGESVGDFDKTVAFIKKMKFSKVHVFPFSAHERTPASKMPGQVAENVKFERSKKLSALSGKLEKAYRQKFKGKKLAVIIDGRSKDGHYRGKTEYYFDVEFESKIHYCQGDSVIVKV